MNVEDKSVVSFDYTLTNDKGEILDSSAQGEPLSILYGAGMIIPGLEKELAGKSKGDNFKVTVQPEEGYGHYNPEFVIELEKAQLGEIEGLQAGSQVQAQSEDGGVHILTVVEIKDETVVLDGNHALAGEVLHFDITITDVREASPEEIDHGHVH